MVIFGKGSWEDLVTKSSQTPANQQKWSEMPELSQRVELAFLGKMQLALVSTHTL